MPYTLEDLGLAPATIALLVALRTQAPKARAVILSKLLEDLSDLSFATKGAARERD
jgi:hypothetical protein